MNSHGHLEVGRRAAAAEAAPTLRTNLGAQEKNLAMIRNGSDDATGCSPPAARGKTEKDWRFWVVIAALSIVGTLPALEGTVVSTALPSIIADLQGGTLYIWVINAYFLTTTAFQPLYGQLADVIGRKMLIISAVSLFAIGSGVSGGVDTMTGLIAGRAVQGVGGGGVMMMIEVIISDYLPVAERGTYLGIIMGICTVGTALGPIIGGLFVQYITWRWVFWINLPISGLALVLLLLFFRSPAHVAQRTPRPSWRRIDFIGNTLLFLALTSTLIALSFGGTSYAWSSFRVVVPLILGFVGLAVWLAYEFSSVCAQPTVPLRLWTNRTSAAALATTFLHSLLMTWTAYFLPVYFQGVLASTPGRSGVQLLPTLILMMFFGAVGGISTGLFGRYKPFQIIGFGLLSLSLGLFSLLDASSSDGDWIGFQLIFGAGGGLCIGTLLQSAQAALPEPDMAAVTAFWAFLRSFGNIWGVAISAAIFDNRTANLSAGLSDPDLKATFASTVGGYQHASKAFLDSLAGRPDVRREVIELFVAALKTVWQAALAFSALAFVVTFAERQIKLRKDFGEDEAECQEKKVTQRA